MEKKLLNIKIEGHPYQVEEGLTIMEAARKCGYDIPHLCTFENGLRSRKEYSFEGHCGGAEGYRGHGGEKRCFGSAAGAGSRV